MVGVGKADNASTSLFSFFFFYACGTMDLKLAN